MADDDDETEKKKHVIYERNDDLHNDSGAYQGGSCCCGHESKYLENNSCSYRWQGCKRAENEDKDLYGDLQNRIRARSPEVAQQMMANGALEGLYGKVKTHKTEGHKYQQVIGKPFRTAFAPWTNQVHHLLPNAVLKDAILATASDYIQVENAIVRGLLTHKYNINLWSNMMILPTEDTVACEIELPSHLGSHDDYSAEVFPKVMQILRPYKAVVRAIKNNKKHPKPKTENIVKQLDNLGITLHGAVIAMRPRVRTRCKADGDPGINNFGSTVKAKLGL